MEPKGAGSFKPKLGVRRLDFAVTLVRAAGRGAEAEARAGEPLALDDEAAIPDRLKGFVAVALENGLIAAIEASGSRRFDPVGKVTRLATCGSLLELLRMLESEPVQAAKPPAKASRAWGAKRALGAR